MQCSAAQNVPDYTKRCFQASFHWCYLYTLSVWAVSCFWNFSLPFLGAKLNTETKAIMSGQCAIRSWDHMISSRPLIDPPFLPCSTIFNHLKLFQPLSIIFNHLNLFAPFLTVYQFSNTLNKFNCFQPFSTSFYNIKFFSTVFTVLSGF